MRWVEEQQAKPVPLALAVAEEVQRLSDAAKARRAEVLTRLG